MSSSEAERTTDRASVSEQSSAGTRCSTAHRVRRPQPTQLEEAPNVLHCLRHDLRRHGFEGRAAVSDVECGLRGWPRRRLWASKAEMPHGATFA